MRRFISIVVFIIFVVFLNIYFNNKKEQNIKELFNNEIIGIIDSIRYDEKSYAFIKVGNKEHYLSLFIITKDNYFREGDSILKKRNSRYLKHYRRNSNKGFDLDGTYELKK